MEEVNIWFPADEAGSCGHAVAWTDELDGRYFNMHTQLATESGQLVLDIKSLRFVAYEAAVPQQVEEPRTRGTYYEVVWEPDIEDIKSEADAIKKIVQLANHKSSLATILLMGSPTNDTLSGCSEVVSRLTTITVGCTSAEELEATKSVDSRIATVERATSTTPWSSISTKDQDVVIVPEDIAKKYSAANLLSELRHVVKNNGFVVICSEDSTLTERSTSLGVFPKMQFNLTEKSVMVFQMTSLQNGTLHEWPKLTVLASSLQDPRLNDLVANIQSEGCVAQVKALTEPSDEDTKLILYDIEGTLLNDLNAENWDIVKRTLNSGKEIMWLTAGVNEGESVFGGMVPGFVRALRSGQAAAKILFIDVSKNEKPESVARLIRSKFDRIVTKDSCGDTEFYLKNGVSYIGRIVPNDRLNGKSFAAQGPAKFATLPTSIAMHGRFVNGEIVFASDNSKTDDLAPDFVEIQITHSTYDKRKISAARPQLVVGKVLRIGSSVSQAIVGQDAIAYTNGSHRTVVHVPHRLCKTYQDLDAAQLIAILPILCQTVNAIMMSAKI
ncbi:MAG: hypothetical protein Q9209_006742 [Squamulea sp. 1 TL-2023]